MSALNKIYEQQYLKSVGEDDDSKKQKREEARSYIDEWIETQYDRTDYDRVYRTGEQDFSTKKRDIEDEVAGKVTCVGDWRKKMEKSVKKRVEKELGTQEEYAWEYAEANFAPRVSLGLILSIRYLLD